MKTHHSQIGITTRQGMPASQRGAALIMSLVLLLILTLLGVAAMRSSSLQQMMAGNTQEINRAFEAAESGLNKAMADTTNFSDMTNSKPPQTYTFSTMNNAGASVSTTFIQTSPPPRSSRPTGTQSAQVAHFDQASTGTTMAGAKSVVHQGVKTNIPAANF